MTWMVKIKLWNSLCLSKIIFCAYIIIIVTQGMALVQRFVKAAVSGMSTKLLCLGVRILRLCPSLLVSDAVILKGLRSAIVSPLVSLRDAAFITAKRVVEDWPPLGLSETYCPLVDGRFTYALSYMSIYIIVTRGGFLLLTNMASLTCYSAAIISVLVPAKRNSAMQAS